MLNRAPMLHAETIDEIVVPSKRRAEPSRNVAASISLLAQSRIADVNARHPHEILTRVPGVWLSRGSGQESLPAIRAPVLSGAGACGAILTLEDGIPTRPAGFCNVNQMFELLTEHSMGQWDRGRSRLTVGADIDVSDTWLRETQDGPTVGSPFLIATRPPGRHYDYTAIGINLAVYVQGEWQLGDELELTAGVRAETEGGLRFRSDAWRIDGSLFAMRKKESVLRDAEGFNVSGGRSRHTGIEFNVDGDLMLGLRIAVAASYARHVYDFDRVAQGETFVAGREIDTAPCWLGSIEAFYTPGPALVLALQWTTIGGYYLDVENAHEYAGHALWNARATLALRPGWDLIARLDNVTDTRYADRADFAFGDYRYFPGRGRELFVELRYSGGER